jgi:hypothetical protein
LNIIWLSTKQSNVPFVKTRLFLGNVDLAKVILLGSLLRVESSIDVAGGILRQLH